MARIIILVLAAHHITSRIVVFSIMAGASRKILANSNTIASNVTLTNMVQLLVIRIDI